MLVASAPLFPQASLYPGHHTGRAFADQRFRSGNRTSDARRKTESDLGDRHVPHAVPRGSQAGPEQPYERIAEQVRARPDWVVGDFGCGECVFADAVRNRVISLDHVACRDDVRVCDLAAIGLDANSLDAAVFSLSLKRRRTPPCPDGPSPKNSENHDSCSTSSFKTAMPQPEPGGVEIFVQILGPTLTSADRAATLSSPRSQSD